MSVIVKRATLWRAETANTPGVLAQTLRPLAENRVDLDIVMGYVFPDRSQAAIEISPVAGPRAQRAARDAGLTRSEFPCVQISGSNRPGLGFAIAQALSDAGININFFVAQVVGNRYSAMFGFEATVDADAAVHIIRKAVAAGSRKTPAKSKGRRPARARR